MVFSSTVFLFLFLPIILAIYYITPCIFKNLFLLIASLIFYCWGEPVYILLMFFSIFVDYFHSMFIEKFRNNKKIAKILLISSISINLGVLCFFKYSNFFLKILGNFIDISFINLPEIALPIGISFYTFQTMSYTIDVYRNNVKPCRNIISFGAYVILFPQLIAGPIVRYKDIYKELLNRRENINLIAKGIRLFLIGLSKKVLLANPVGELWESLRKMPSENGILGCWIGVIAFSFQIYFDFSGYSDMARGLGFMFGFKFIKNFDYPYISKNITEFWRRWHISLGVWFKEYLYIPLGGNRKGKIKLILNLMIVWFFTGFWHGASVNFVLWGLYFGIILIIEKFFILKILKFFPKFLSYLYSIFLILIGWVIFYFEDLYELITYIKFLFRSQNILSTNALYMVISNLPILIVCAIASTPFVYKIYKKIDKNKKKYLYLESSVILMLLMLCTASIVNQGYNPFLYFRF